MSLPLLFHGLLLFLWQEPGLTLNRDVVRALQALNLRIEDFRARAERNETLPEAELLAIPLDRLIKAVDRNAGSRILWRDGPSLSIEANNEILFETLPVLPPERKSNGQWTFTPVRFEVVPDHLWVYSLRFVGDHTLRIRSVRLHFRDGVSITHNAWNLMEDGNGKEFSKNDYITDLIAWLPGEERRARPLAAIEILGSAQDGEFSSLLSFTLEVPDPEVEPYAEARGKLLRMRKEWLSGSLTASRLTNFKEDLRELSRLLNEEL